MTETEPRPLYYIIKILNNLMVIADNNIYNDVPSIVSSDKAAESQLAYSSISEIVLNYNLNIDNIKSIVNEVASRKLTISNNDPRVVQMKNQINILNDILPENVRFTQDQLGSYYPTLEENSTLKKVLYLGFYMTYDTFNSFIDIAKQNHVTHILLEFIILAGDLTALTYADTIANWMTFTPEQRSSLRTKIENNGMKLMASFGGATSFPNGFEKILNTQLTYSNPEKLANDLVNFCYDYNIPGIDLDIENFPTTTEYPDTSALVTYVGSLSNYIKNLSQTKFGYFILVSHAPQSPYFNNNTYGYLYNNIEKSYGAYIDFYNIQYYNQGDNYTNYTQIFLNDQLYFASVYELINASIPSNKIIVGKGTKEETYSGGYVPLYDINNIKNTMAGYVESTKYDGNQQIIQWNAQGGIMVWLYKIEQGSSYSYNVEIMNYFTYVFNKA